MDRLFIKTEMYLKFEAAASASMPNNKNTMVPRSRSNPPVRLKSTSRLLYTTEEHGCSMATFFNSLEDGSLRKRNSSRHHFFFIFFFFFNLPCCCLRVTAIYLANVQSHPVASFTPKDVRINVFFFLVSGRIVCMTASGCVSSLVRRHRR